MPLSLSALVGIVAMSSQVDVDPREDLTLSEALTEGVVSAELRLRYEDVETRSNPNSVKGAQAPTVAFKASYETAPYYYLRAFAEYTNVSAIPDDDNYFSGANDELDDALVADHEMSFASRYWLGYDVANTLIKYGRQAVVLDNERFFGQQDFRHAGSTLSGVSISNESFNFLKLKAGRFYRYESPLDDSLVGGQRGLDARFGHIEYRGIIHSLLSLYINDIDDETPGSLSDSRSYGVRFAGDIKNEPRIEYAFEWASQKGAHNNPNDYTHHYSQIFLGITYSNIRITGGRESLGGGSNGYFVTPLADFHRFQGMADQFDSNGLGNIAGGIVDRYGSLGYVFSDSAMVEAKFHRFESDDASAGAGDLGNELDLSAQYSWHYLDMSLNYADYQAKNYGSDTRKIWVELKAGF